MPWKWGKMMALKRDWRDEKVPGKTEVGWVPGSSWNNNLGEKAQGATDGKVWAWKEGPEWFSPFMSQVEAKREVQIGASNTRQVFDPKDRGPGGGDIKWWASLRDKVAGK